jgi:hypothetical protein
MRSSETTAELAKALALFMEKAHNPLKSEEVKAGAKRYSFAPLPEILTSVRPALARCGLSLVMDTVTEDSRVGVAARLMHTSGEWIEYGPLLLNAGNDAQSAGSALTYARRYLLCAALGIAADDDDDGAKASGWGKATQPAASAAPVLATESGAQAGDGATHPSVSGAADRPEPEVYGEGTEGSGEREGEGTTKETTAGVSPGDGTPHPSSSEREPAGDAAPAVAPPPAPDLELKVAEPHEHVAGPKKLASGKPLCSVCGHPFKPEPVSA